MSYKLFKRENPAAIQWSEKLGLFFRMAKQKFYMDEMYLFITRKIIFRLIAAPAAWIDKNIVDGFINLLARITEVFSISTAGFQSGKLQSYAAWMLGGVIVLIVMIYLFQNSIVL
jgi:NADH-quinone oxidoreductase subunit L